MLQSFYRSISSGGTGRFYRFQKNAHESQFTISQKLRICAGYFIEKPVTVHFRIYIHTFLLSFSLFCIKRSVIQSAKEDYQICNRSGPVDKVEPAGSYRSSKTFRPAGPNRFSLSPTGYNSGMLLAISHITPEIVTDI